MKIKDDIIGTEADIDVQIRLNEIVNSQPKEGEPILDPVTLTFYRYIDGKWLLLLAL